MAAAAFVRTTLMPELSSVDQTYASLARRPANGKKPPGLCAALKRSQKPLELIAVVAALATGRPVARQHAGVAPATDGAERDAEHAGGLRDGEPEARFGGRSLLHDRGCRPLRAGWQAKDRFAQLCLAGCSFRWADWTRSISPSS